MSTSVRSSMAIDAATLGTAAVRLEREINAPLQSNGTPAQNQFVQWLGEHREDVHGLQDVRVMASDDYNVLNRFLVAANYSPLFRPIPPRCHGVAAILDMVVKWLCDTELTSVESMTSDGMRRFEGFSIPLAGAYIFEAEGHSEFLVQLLTKDGSSAWLTKAPQPRSELELLDFATRMMNTRHTPHLNHFTEVVVPMVSIKRTVSLEWLLGASCGPEVIDQAFQIISVDIDETGGHIKSATGMATRECAMITEPLVLDSPFALWFTQGVNGWLPIASVYANHDVWKPQG